MMDHSRAHLHLPAGTGSRMAYGVVRGMGSWRFIIVQTAIVAAWLVLNGFWLTHRAFDPFPFILLNLVFSTQAAYASPLILMAGNLQADRDRARDDHEAEEVSLLYRINTQQLEILKRLEPACPTD